MTPAEIDGICSGKVRVEVKHAAGKFIKDLVLEKDEAVSLDCPIRPTLAFLGVEAASAAGLRYLADAEEKIQANLVAARLAQLHRRPARGRRPDAGAGAAHPAVAAAGSRHRPGPRAQGDGADGRWHSRCRVSWWRCCRRSGCSARRACTCWRPATRPPRPWTSPSRESPAYAPLLTRLDAVFASERPWSGLVTLDTLLHDGVPVLRVVPRKPGGAGRRAAGGPGLGSRRPAGEADRRPARRRSRPRRPGTS